MAASLGPRLRILGSTGSYVKYGLDGQEDALRSGRTPADEGWGIEPRETYGKLEVGAKCEPVVTEPGAYEAYYAAVVEALHGRGPTPVDPRDAVAALSVLEAARRSAEEERVMRITTRA
jgi:scyllo-inositol 2-dehydrogenase (NADP+)